MKFMLLLFLVGLATFSCACSWNDHTYLFARDHSLNELSSEQDPFILISYDAIQDVNFAHFRTASEMLEQNLEVLALSSEVKFFDNGTLFVKEVLDSKIGIKNIDIIFKASAFLLEYPVAFFNKRPEDKGLVTRKYYELCEADDEGCITIYLRSGELDGDFIFVFDTDQDDRCAELSNCSIPSHIDLFSKVYNVRMDGPKFIEHSSALCLFVYALAEMKADVAIAFQLLEKTDSPELFWSVLKEFIKHADTLKTVSRIFMKKYPGEDRYRLILRLTETPTEEILESIRSIVRPYFGPISSIGKDGVSECGVAMYEAFRFDYSDLLLCSLDLSNRSREKFLVKDQKSFEGAMSKIKGQAGFRMFRSFPQIKSTEFFQATIDCPKFDRVQIFEQFGKHLFFSGNRWTDCLASLEVRMEKGNFLSVRTNYYMIQDHEIPLIQLYLVQLGKKIYSELTGKITLGTSSQLFESAFPSKKTNTPKILDATTPKSSRPALSRPLPPNEPIAPKKIDFPARNQDSRKKTDFRKKKNVKKTVQYAPRNERSSPNSNEAVSVKTLLYRESEQLTEVVDTVEEPISSNEISCLTHLRALSFPENNDDNSQLNNCKFMSIYDFELVEAMAINAESHETLEKPLSKPEDLSEFGSWLYDLTEDEFEDMLVDFEERLKPFHLTSLSHLPPNNVSQ